jgi:flagellin
MRIYNNVNAVNAQRNLSITGFALAKSIEKLSSGLRINRAADDAAGLSISEKLRAQIRGVQQAMRNAQDGVSMIQTAEGALNEVHSMLQRMRELAVQAANDTLTTEDRQAIYAELNNLRQEINAIAQRTTFNGKPLLTGSLTAQFDAGASSADGVTITDADGDTATVSAVSVSPTTLVGTYTFSSSGTDLTLTLGASGPSQTLDLSTVSVSAGGTYTLNFDQLGISLTISAAAGNTGAITGSDIASGLTGETVVVTGGAANFQVGPNASHYYLVGFADVQIGATVQSTQMQNLNAALNTFNTSLGQSNSSQVTAAQALVTSVDGAISYVNQVRSELGAAQNRLEHTIANLGVQNENLTASESRIRDVDMAAEMVTFTRNQILQQAGVAVLAQANAIPQSVLQLLR